MDEFNCSSHVETLKQLIELRKEQETSKDLLNSEITKLKVEIAKLRTQMLFIIPLITVICTVAIQKLFL